MTCNFARCFLAIIVSSLSALSVLAQGSNHSAAASAASAANAAAAQEACKRDVQKYQSHIDFVRKSLGDQEADALAARFMARAEWEALLQKEGHCGLSKRLRAQKLV